MTDKNNKAGREKFLIDECGRVINKINDYQTHTFQIYDRNFLLAPVFGSMAMQMTLKYLNRLFMQTGRRYLFANLKVENRRSTLRNILGKAEVYRTIYRSTNGSIMTFTIYDLAYGMTEENIAFYGRDLNEKNYNSTLVLSSWTFGNCQLMVGSFEKFSENPGYFDNSRNMIVMLLDSSTPSLPLDSGKRLIFEDSILLPDNKVYRVALAASNNYPSFSSAPANINYAQYDI